MDTNQLCYFRAVAETLNFTRAANNLYMSQTTLSYQISSLEKEIGTKLFNRGHAGVTLTSSGEKLLEYVPRILDIVDEAIEVTINASRGYSSTLSVGFIGSHEQHILPVLISEFNERYPDIDVILRQGSPRRLLTQLENKNLDIVFVLSMDTLESGAITFDYFEKMPFYAIMRDDNEFANREMLERRELTGQKLCFLSEDEGPELNRHFIESFRGNGDKVTLIDTSATMESVIMLIDSKGYVTIAPRCLMPPYHDTLVAIPMKGDREFIYHGLAWRSDNKNPAVELFTQFANECFDKYVSEGKMIPA